MAVARLCEEDFVDSDDAEALQCPICLKILKEPRFGSCQHVFCQVCIEGSLKMTPECPQCRMGLRGQVLTKPLHIVSQMDKAKVFCPKRCGWQGRFEYRASHLADSCSAVVIEKVKQELATIDVALQANEIERVEVERERGILVQDRDLWTQRLRDVEEAVAKGEPLPAEREDLRARKAVRPEDYSRIGLRGEVDRLKQALEKLRAEHEAEIDRMRAGVMAALIGQAPTPPPAAAAAGAAATGSNERPPSGASSTAAAASAAATGSNERPSSGAPSAAAAGPALAEVDQGVKDFLTNAGLGQYIDLFAKQGLHTVDILRSLEQRHILNIGLAVGDVLKLEKAMAKKLPGMVKEALRRRLEPMRRRYSALPQAEKKANDDALVEAAQEGNLLEVKRLLEQAGANANAADSDGQTAVFWAARNGHLKMAKFLVEEAGADAEAVDNSGWTPLHWAALEGQLDLAKFLVEEAGADAKAVNSSGETPLHKAVFWGKLDLAKFLVEEAGADAEAADNSGETPLHKAAFMGQLGVAKFLVEEAGADAKATKNSGETPLHKAAGRGDLEVAKILVEEAGADAKAIDNSGLTPLHWAAANGKLEVAKFLVEEAGADINARANNGQTPLAKAYGRAADVAAFLQSHGGQQ